MLAKSVKEIPNGAMSFEPKWDGFRSIIFRDGDEVEIGSRNEKPMTRYFPELVEACRANLPERCVVDGEIIVVGPSGDRLEFEVLAAAHPPGSEPGEAALGADTGQLRGLRPAGTRRRRPDGQAVHRTPYGARRGPFDGEGTHPHTAATTDRTLAERWFQEFEGAGLDGLMAKPLAGVYAPDKRTMFKIKPERTADCVVAGYRVHKSGPDRIGSLLLGLYGEDGTLASVGVIGAFPMERRKELFEEMQPLVTTFDDHPWAWAKQEEGTRTPRNAEGSRWAAGKDLSFTPLRPELVVEVRYDHMEGVRFRHTAQFVRWRPDRDPRSCTYEQLEVPVSYDLADVLVADGQS